MILGPAPYIFLQQSLTHSSLDPLAAVSAMLSGIGVGLLLIWFVTRR